GGDVVYVPAVEANCHQTGNVEYWYCAECEQVWADEARTQLTNFKNVITPATAEIVYVAGVEATCTTNGNVEYWYCSECDAVFTDVALTQLSNRLSVVLPAGHVYTYACDAHCANCYELTNPDASHTVEFVDAVDATCTVNGNVAYWYCTECGIAWLDEALTQQTNLMSVVTPAFGHNDENEDFKCDNCATKMLPADGTALTIPQALAIAKLVGTTYTTQKYYITGIIKNVYNTTFGNMYIQDAEGNELCIYGLYSYDGKIRYDAMSYKPVAGDEVTVYTVLGMYNTTCQGKNAWLDEVVAHEHIWVDATCTAPKTCTLCAVTEGDVMDHEYVDGSCVNCGKAESSNALSNATLSFSNKANRITFTTSQQVWEQNGVRVINDKASSTSNVADYANPARFYKSSKLTIEGAGMTKIAFTCNNDSYATALKNSIGTVSGATVSVSGSVVTVTFETAVDSFVINSLTGGQVRMNSITVNG
ncbi:MAG: hypothetical protein IJX97_01930, partial [Clostridia bacterium]|nr:hypothetical protein [Clostridia bacterium]